MGKLRLNRQFCYETLGGRDMQAWAELKSVRAGEGDDALDVDVIVVKH